MAEKKTLRDGLQAELDLLLYLVPAWQMLTEAARKDAERTQQPEDIDAFMKCHYDLTMRLDRIKFISRVLRDYE